MEIMAWHCSPYRIANAASVHAGLGVQVTSNASTGNGLDFLIGRLSYTFGLTGPCVSTHTACSSSLVSTHLAVHGLAGRDCHAAVTAGVFLILLDGTMAGICQLQVSTIGTLKLGKA